MGVKKTTTLYNDYDSGEIDGVHTEGGEVTVTPDNRLSQLLVYPAVDASVKLNDSEKWIYLPAGAWTPISVACDSFKIKGASESGKIYWQGWIL